MRIHVIGDGAIHAALDIFEEAVKLYGLPQRGHNTLEHLENLLPQDIDRLRKLNVIASSQPCHITLDPGGPERDLGLERSRIMWPFATYKQRGIRQAFGTDSPITPVTSMNVLYTAITRQDPKSHWPEGGWLPSERIDAATALRNYTLGGIQKSQCSKMAMRMGCTRKGHVAETCPFKLRWNMDCFLLLRRYLVRISPQLMGGMCEASVRR